MSLRDTQRLFWDVITHPQGTEAFLRDAQDAVRASVGQTFGHSAAFPLVERLDVYANAYFYRLKGALEQVFPVVARELGAERFHNLVTDYLLAHPSTDPDLHRLGQHLPVFLRSHPVTQAVPQTPALATVEFEIARCLDAPDTSMLGASDLASVPLEEWLSWPLSLRASCRLINVDYDYTQFRDAGSPAPSTGVFSILVWRQGFQVFTRHVGPAEAAALRAVESGDSFTQLCERLAQRADLSPNLGPEQVATWLQNWLKDELLAKPERHTK